MGIKILLLEMHCLGDLGLVEGHALRSYDQLIFRIILPASRTDHNAVKGFQGLCDPKNVGILLFSVSCHAAGDVAVIDGIYDTLVYMADGAINHHMDSLTQKLPDQPLPISE